MSGKHKPGATFLLRMSHEDRERIRRAVPHGTLNATAVQLLLDHVRRLEANGLLPLGGETEDATTAA